MTSCIHPSASSRSRISVSTCSLYAYHTSWLDVSQSTQEDLLISLEQVVDRRRGHHRLSDSALAAAHPIDATCCRLVARSLGPSERSPSSLRSPRSQDAARTSVYAAAKPSRCRRGFRFRRLPKPLPRAATPPCVPPGIRPSLPRKRRSLPSPPSSEGLRGDLRRELLEGGLTLCLAPLLPTESATAGAQDGLQRRYRDGDPVLRKQFDNRREGVPLRSNGLNLRNQYPDGLRFGDFLVMVWGERLQRATDALDRVEPDLGSRWHLRPAFHDVRQTVIVSCPES